jgi:ATP-dependent Clp protease adaptor protein ClpS
MKLNTVVLEQPVVEKKKPRRKQQPRYHVILWDDNDHTYGYVIQMMRELFGFQESRGMQIAEAVDQSGRAICMTTTRELAELKRDQIHAFGKDDVIRNCKGSMWASIEPQPETS